MNQEPLVSVIIPNYNYAHFLKGCIDSVLNQTYNNTEIIIIDDCSNDGSRQFYESIAHLANVIILYNSENVGVVASRNRGLQVAKGQYIALLDPDDEWLPNKLELQVAAAVAGNNIICTGLAIINTKGEQLKIRQSLFKHITYTNMLKSNSIPNSSALITRQFLGTQLYSEVGNPYFGKKVPFISTYKYLIHEDYAFWLRLLKQNDARVCYLTQPLVRYRVHATSYSGNIVKKILSIYVIFRQQEKFSIISSVIFTMRLLLLAVMKNRGEN